MADFFFPFPDGSLDYRCDECNALCCRGQGFAGQLQQELVPLLKLYPPLRHAVNGRDKGTATFATPNGACFFLEPDRRCRVEAEHGRAAKPSVCRLFPFNRFSWLGETLVVAPHFLCPLRLIDPARPGEVQGSHERLAASLEADGALGMAPRRPEGAVDPGLKGSEQAFLARCTAALGKTPFAATLESSATSATEHVAGLRRASDLLGLADAQTAPIDAVDSVMHVLASSLRLSLLALPEAVRLRTLGLVEHQVRSLTPLLRSPWTLQAVQKVAADTLPGLALLARADLPLPALPPAAPGSSRVPSLGEPRLVFAAQRVIAAAGGTAATLDVFEDALGPLDLLDRTALTQTLGRIFWRPASSRDAEPAAVSVAPAP